jgi:uncharacterized protein YeaO (DUF488 family)
MIRCKRIYEPSERGDGYRVLVDRLWPRGLKKEEAAFDVWIKDIAPSTELRQWYGHRSEAWPEFQQRYRQELKRPEAAAELEKLREIAAKRPLTLLTATKEVAESHAAVLKAVLGHH